MMTCVRIIALSPTLSHERARGRACAERAHGDLTMRGKTF
jgi:hypothetical protein